MSKYDAVLPRIRVSEDDLARWRRQAHAAGVTLAEATRRALDAYFAAPAETSSAVEPAEDRVAALRGLLAERGHSVLTGSQRQALNATVRQALEEGTAPDVIEAQLSRQFPLPAIRDAINRMDGAA